MGGWVGVEVEDAGHMVALNVHAGRVRPKAKVLAMKQTILLLLSGEQLPPPFLTIVRYMLLSEDHTVHKPGG